MTIISHFSDAILLTPSSALVRHMFMNSFACRRLPPLAAACLSRAFGLKIKRFHYAFAFYPPFPAA
jgi:hypothetical protein